MFKYLIAICLIVIACGPKANSNCNQPSGSASEVYIQLGTNHWVGTRVNIQGVDCVVVAQHSGGNQISPSISCNWNNK